MSVAVEARESREALAEALAAHVADALRAALSARGRAALAVPGGATPAAFLTRLGAAALDWSRVAVTLTDERWVPTSSDRSNQRLLAQTLFAGPAAAAEFVPLYGATAEPAQSLGAIQATLANLILPLDVVVLGMGADMHAASLFPGADKLAQALADDAPPALALRAPGAPEPRITLTAPVLRAAAEAHLLIHGADKAAALDRARTLPPEDAPVAVALTRRGPTTVWRAP